MPTLIETESPQACAELCHELGLAFIELNMNLPAYQTDRLDMPLLRELAGRYGIYYTIHLDENLNPCDFNRDVARAYTLTVMNTIEKAARLGVPVLNMHLSTGVYFTLPDRRVYLFEQYRDEYLRGLVQFRDLCGQAARNAGITICVENCSGWAAFQQEAVNLLLEHPSFGLTYDVGHDCSAGYADRDFILSREEHLRHIHLHDAAGKRDHLTLGDGELDLCDRLSLAEKHGCRVVAETKTIASLRRSAEWLRSKGFISS